MSRTGPMWDVSAIAQDVLGHLNFSSGTPDPRFLENLNKLFTAVEGAKPKSRPVWRMVAEALHRELQAVGGTTDAFRRVEQAEAVLGLVFEAVLPAYRLFHRDLLFHQTEEGLFQPFFVGRVCEAVLQQGGPWGQTDRIVRAVLRQLNDYLGHRPVAVLHTERKIQPYEHEWVRPIPLWIRGAGVAVGPYRELIETALAILDAAQSAILFDAMFAIDQLDELALDPRAYDFDHPVNHRPNYMFGQWDMNKLDNAGLCRRFVLQQTALDAMLDRLSHHGRLPRKEVLFEEAAVLAGTMLMGSGVSGNRPDAHDSTITLATLVQKIAHYRDAFYDQLLGKLSGPHAERLRAEALTLRQPFGAARQHFNQYLARRRAQQLEHVHLAQMFAAMGCTEQAMRHAAVVPVASARMTCEMRCRMAAAHLAIEQSTPHALREATEQSTPHAPREGRSAKKATPGGGAAHKAATGGRAEHKAATGGRAEHKAATGGRAEGQAAAGGETAADRLHQAAAQLPLIEDLLHRAIECGAIIDPWNILGFGGQYSLFPAVENSITDHRVDQLLDMMSDIFLLYVRIYREAAAAKDTELQQTLSENLAALARWWDQFATMEVGSVEGISGQATLESAESAAAALGTWHEGGAAAGDVAFWRRNVEHFRGPKAYALVIDTLLDRGDFVASMALLVQWLSEGEEVPLVEEDYSFHDLALVWMEDLWQGDGGAFGETTGGRDKSSPESSSVPSGPVPNGEHRWPLARKFLDYLEANAEEYWQVPRFEMAAGVLGDEAPPPDEDEEEGEDESADEDDLFGAAYEHVTYRDSTDDGVESELFETGPSATEFELVGEAERIVSRLNFLTTVAQLWRLAATASVGNPAADRDEVLGGWLEQAARNHRELLDLLASVHRHRIPEPRGTHESLVEYDRRRSVQETLLEEIIQATVETADAARMIRASNGAAIAGR